MDDFEDMLTSLDDEEIADILRESEEGGRYIADEIERSLEGFEDEALSYDIPLNC